MADIRLFATGCGCTQGCRAVVEPMEMCVEYQARSNKVETKYCRTCESSTWHKNGDCMRCAHQERRP